jgi:hypothetical protein
LPDLVLEFVAGVYVLVAQVLVWKELDYGSMTEREKQMLVSEVNILRELRHPNIVRSVLLKTARSHSPARLATASA